jgi:hypothetical protein
MGTTAQGAPAQAGAEQFTFESGFYELRKTLAANIEAKDLALFFDREMDVVWLALSGLSTGAYEVQLTLPNGRLLSSAPLHNTCSIGSAAFPAELPHPEVVPAGGKVGAYLKDLSGAQNDIRIVFWCLRRLRQR